MSQQRERKAQLQLVIHAALRSRKALRDRKLREAIKNVARERAFADIGDGNQTVDQALASFRRDLFNLLPHGLSELSGELGLSIEQAKVLRAMRTSRSISAALRSVAPEKEVRDRSTGSRWMGVTSKRIAEWLIDSEALAGDGFRSPAKMTGQSGGRSIVEMLGKNDLTPLINRKPLQQEIFNLLAAGEMMFLLWGESGDGKTELAIILADQIAHDTGKTAVSIRVGEAGDHRNELTKFDLFRALTSMGIDARFMNYEAQLLALRGALASDSCAIGALVIDDVTRSFAERVVPKSPSIPIILTGSEVLPNIANAIHVPEFSPEEALEFAQLLLPLENPSDLTSLSALLGNRPIALDVAVRTIILELVSLEDLLSSLRTSAYDTLEASVVLTGKGAEFRLFEVYRRALRSIEDRELIMRVLDALVWLLDENVPIDYLRGFLFEHHDGALQDLQFAAAMEELARMHLVRVRSEVVEMNRLTWTILRRLCSGRVPIVIESLCSVLDGFSATSSDAGRLLRLEYATTQQFLSDYVLTHGVFGILYLNESTWFVSEEDSPWSVEASLGNGRALIEIVGDGEASVFRIYHADGSTRELTSVQTALFWYVARLSSEVSIDILFMDRDPDARVKRLGLNVGSPLPTTNARHWWIGRSILGDIASELQSWTLCGCRGKQPRQPRANLPVCESCEAMFARVESWFAFFVDFTLLTSLFPFARERSIRNWAHMLLLRASIASQLNTDGTWAQVKDQLVGRVERGQALAIFLGAEPLHGMVAEVLDTCLLGEADGSNLELAVGAMRLLPSDRTPSSRTVVWMVESIRKTVGRDLLRLRAIAQMEPFASSQQMDELESCLTEILSHNNLPLLELVTGKCVHGLIVYRQSGSESALPIFESGVKLGSKSRNRSVQDMVKVNREQVERISAELFERTENSE